MKLWFRRCNPLVVLVCVLGLGPVRAGAGLIVGIEYTGNLQGPQHMFAVDPLTGNVTPLATTVGPGYFFETSSGPAYDSILVYMANLYQVDVITGKALLYACPTGSGCGGYVGDLAYDWSNGVIYGLGTMPGEGAESLFRLNDSGMEYPGFPGSHWISYSPVGHLGVNGISVMEFVPGLGLYGVTNGAGFVIDEKTGQASFLASLFGPGIPYLGPYGITGLAYDSETGRLLANSGCTVDCGPPGAIFLLDPSSGLVTPLNVNAPNLVGIAEARTPEPGPAWMLLVGLTACFVVRRFRWLYR